MHTPNSGSRPRVLHCAAEGPELREGPSTLDSGWKCVHPVCMGGNEREDYLRWGQRTGAGAFVELQTGV